MKKADADNTMVGVISESTLVSSGVVSGPSHPLKATPTGVGVVLDTPTLLQRASNV